MSIEDSFQPGETRIARAPVIHSSHLTYDKRRTYIGFMRGSIDFLESSVLHVRPFVNVEHDVERYMYAPRDLSRAGHTFTYDALYIKRQSFWLDLKLIALSFWITFRGKWEYRGKKF